MEHEVVWNTLTAYEKFQVIKTNPLFVPPKTKVISKDKGFGFWKLLDVLWKVLTLGKGSFMTRTTTIGPYIAFPKGWVERNADDHDCAILLHEAKHMKQRLGLGLGKSLWLGSFIFVFAYLFLPVPIGRAYLRYKWEREAYLEQWKAPIRFNLDVEYDIRNFVELLSGRSYFWAWTKKTDIRKWFLKHCMD